MQQLSLPSTSAFTKYSLELFTQIYSQSLFRYTHKLHLLAQDILPSVFQDSLPSVVQETVIAKVLGANPGW